MRALCLVLCVSAACSTERPAARPDWEPAFDAGAAWLVNVTASPRGEQWWAVGGTNEQGLLLDGSRDFASAEVVDIGDAPLLHWVHAFSPTEALAVGKHGTVLRQVDGQWRREPVQGDQDLWGVWGASADDVWAVGGDGLAEGNATILHWDGDRWAVPALPTLTRPRVWAWYKVWGSSAHDVYFVGQSGGVLHFDGQQFEELGLGTAEDLIAVWGTGPDRVAVVGGRSSAVLSTFDGARWNTGSLSPLPGLNGVFMRNDQTIHVAGIEGTLARVDFDSHAYAIESLPTPTRLVFHALHGAGDLLVAVGGNLGSSVPPYRSLAYARALTDEP